jgi:hypothetical protein
MNARRRADELEAAAHSALPAKKSSLTNIIKSQCNELKQTGILFSHAFVHAVVICHHHDRLPSLQHLQQTSHSPAPSSLREMQAHFS